MNSICPSLLINPAGSSQIPVPESLKGGNRGRWELLTGIGAIRGEWGMPGLLTQLFLLSVMDFQGQGWG